MAACATRPAQTPKARLSSQSLTSAFVPAFPARQTAALVASGPFRSRSPRPVVYWGDWNGDMHATSVSGGAGHSESEEPWGLHCRHRHARAVRRWTIGEIYFRGPLTDPWRP